MEENIAVMVHQPVQVIVVISCRIQRSHDFGQLVFSNCQISYTIVFVKFYLLGLDLSSASSSDFSPKSESDDFRSDETGWTTTTGKKADLLPKKQTTKRVIGRQIFLLNAKSLDQLAQKEEYRNKSKLVLK